MSQNLVDAYFIAVKREFTSGIDTNFSSSTPGQQVMALYAMSPASAFANEINPKGIDCYRAKLNCDSLVVMDDEEAYVVRAGVSIETLKMVISSLNSLPKTTIRLIPLPTSDGWDLIIKEVTCLISSDRETRNGKKTCGVPLEARNEAEKTLHDFLREFDQECQDPFWNQFRSSLRILLSRRQRWTMRVAGNWKDKAVGPVFTPSLGAIVSTLMKDTEEAPSRYLNPHQFGLNVLYQGKLLGSNFLINNGDTAWRNLLFRVFRKSIPFSFDTRLQASGAPKEDQYSVLGYMVSPRCAEKLCNDKPPRYNRWDESFEWKTHPGSAESMEIYATCTHAGHFTAPHEDGPGMDAYIWHVTGIKLWVVWPPTPFNVEKLSFNNASASDLDWCLDNLDGAEVYLLGLEQHQKIILPGASCHAVWSFTQCLALSSFFFSMASLDRDVRSISYMQKALKNRKLWITNSEFQDAEKRTKFVKNSWDHYLSRQGIAPNMDDRLKALELEERGDTA